jgi:hypothetical protein
MLVLPIIEVVKNVAFSQNYLDVGMPEEKRIVIHI